jgi:hypothetical protein
MTLPIETKITDFPYHVDAGFINRRKCYSWLSPGFRLIFDKYKESGDDHFALLRNDHKIIEICIAQATRGKIPGVREALASGFSRDHVYCGTEVFAPIDDLYDAKRVRTEIQFETASDWRVFLEFGTEHIFSDTLRMLLNEGAHESFIAHAHSVDPAAREVILHPLFIGAPYIGHRAEGGMAAELLWHSRDFYQIHAEQIEEFQKITDISVGDEWVDAMRGISEDHVKRSFANILGDPTKKDWGGEFDDHYTTGIHVGGRRFEASFLLKGPSDFKEMTPAHLGKNGDQIFRIACTPANLLIIQHSHTIGAAVRATLQAFCYNPANTRRYCFIDGKETFRILKAYQKI